MATSSTRPSRPPPLSVEAADSLRKFWSPIWWLPQRAMATKPTTPKTSDETT